MLAAADFFTTEVWTKTGLVTSPARPSSSTASAWSTRSAGASSSSIAPPATWCLVMTPAMTLDWCRRCAPSMAAPTPSPGRRCCGSSRRRGSGPDLRGAAAARGVRGMRDAWRSGARAAGLFRPPFLVLELRPDALHLIRRQRNQPGLAAAGEDGHSRAVGTGWVGPQRQALAAIGEDFDDAAVDEDAQMQRLAILEIEGPISGVREATSGLSEAWETSIISSRLLDLHGQA